MKVLLHGCNGKMGQVMTRVLEDAPSIEIVCGVDLEPGKFENKYPVYSSLGDVKEDCDLLVDFSHRSSLGSILDFGKRRGVSLVICTTGFAEEEKRQMLEASSSIPVLHSPNMSLGVNLLLSLVKRATHALGEGFDIEIVEKHHNEKVDSPSGTALLLADAVKSASDNDLRYVYGRHSKNERREKGDLGIHAVRGGAYVGEHNVYFVGQGEVVEISHTAFSREVFAYGALRAILFLHGKKPGLYGMNDVIEVTSEGFPS